MAVTTPALLAANAAVGTLGLYALCAALSRAYPELACKVAAALRAATAVLIVGCIWLMWFCAFAVWALATGRIE